MLIHSRIARRLYNCVVDKHFHHISLSLPFTWTRVSRAKKIIDILTDLIKEMYITHAYHAVCRN